MTACPLQSTAVDPVSTKTGIWEADAVMSWVAMLYAPPQSGAEGFLHAATTCVAALDSCQDEVNYSKRRSSNIDATQVTVKT